MFNKVFGAKKKQDDIIIICTGCDHKIVREYQDKCSVFGKKVSFDIKDADSNTRVYCYSPKRAPLDENQMMQVVYTLICYDLDYIIASKTLDEYPLAGAACIEDIIIYRQSKNNMPDDIKKGKKALCGKILRLPGKERTDDTINIKEEIPCAVLEKDSYLITKKCRIPEFKNTSFPENSGNPKKMIFVFPIFMAVGGVERNTIEIMRQLQNEYDFCVVTMERHSKAQGSLNYQLGGLCVADFDLRELIEFDSYFYALKQLKDIYKPDVVWLCNNSPWLEANLLEFRKVFANQAIIAQDVYDTKYGWIEYYDTEGIQSLDGYIAINKKIEECFINKYNIQNEKIDVIYPAVDDKKIRNEIAIPVDRIGICKKYGLDPNKKHFTYVGRLTEQKNPVRYVELATKAMTKYQDMEWIIVGDGALAEQVDAAIEKNGMTNRIKRLPYVANVPELYKVIDGLIIVSFYEGMPIVSIEAMSMGVPIFGTDVGDLKIFVDKINCGNIIPIENEDDFSEFVLWYEKYNQYKVNATEHAIEILDFFSANNLAKLYKMSFEKGIKQMVETFSVGGVL